MMSQQIKRRSRYKDSVVLYQAKHLQKNLKRYSPHYFFILNNVVVFNKLCYFCQHVIGLLF